jgi:hypothetical protein
VIGFCHEPIEKAVLSAPAESLHQKEPFEP